MKKFKKHPKQQLEKFSTVFTQLGLVLVLFIVFISLEHQSENVAIKEPDRGEEINTVITLDKPFVYVKEIPQKRVKPKKRTQIIEITKVDVVDKPLDVNDLPIIDPTPDEPSFIDGLTTVDENFIDKEDDPNPVNYSNVQEIPVFEGCEGMSQTETRKCFDKKMNRLVQRYFNADLANELGLSPGKKRIFTEFVIDKNGEVVEVKVRAPHPRLSKEAQKIVSKIPQFTPGRQNGKPVKVKYTLPITFRVE
ncbi:energy transducer TonB [Tenacibaculum sp. IB213877]|uniref:energy transducer TonB n=1 Tax=Tenacibaculum sp. IB213877 TaxID=3097351 RepID=UPI002A5A64E1|nr:energy transducer TonB [Tenacibaculum sp. IB213877]MDY0780633.1 energy transducer TonB [Tenacibaculum sp. IB213877]